MACHFFSQSGLSVSLMPPEPKKHGWPHLFTSQAVLNLIVAQKHLKQMSVPSAVLLSTRVTGVCAPDLDLCSAGDHIHSLLCAALMLCPLSSRPLNACWNGFFECYCEGHSALVTMPELKFSIYCFQGMVVPELPKLWEMNPSGMPTGAPVIPKCSACCFLSLSALPPFSVVHGP